MNKLSRLYILFLLFFAAAALAFADQPSSALDDKPSVDTAADSVTQVPALPSNASTDTHTSYLYDLKKLIEKSRENIKEVNDKIKEQAILKRNQEREERSHQYYEKGEELTKEGKLDEAREYFEKAIRITEHPEMAGYLKESKRRLQKQEAALNAQERQHENQIKQDENARKQEVEEAYKGAIDLYRQKKYHPAQDAFKHVDEIAPDYRATSSYLKIIEQDVILEDAMAVKQKAVEAEHQQQEAEAARSKEKAAWLKQIEAKEKERKDQESAQADAAYTQAINLYKNKKFAEAKKKFEEVSWVVPDYKDTMKYLRRIDRDAQVEQEHVAQQQQKSLEQQHWEELVAAKKQEAVRQHELAIKEIKHREELEEQAQFLYSAAVNLYDKKDMDQAWVKFNDIEKTCPDYRSTRAYIQRISKTNPAKFKIIVAPAAVVPATPEQIASASSLQALQAQVQEISDLVRRAAAIYTKVVDIDDDKLTAQMRRKLAQVNKILNGLMHSKERLLAQMRKQQSKLQQEQARAEQEKHRDEAEKIYQSAVKYFQEHDYERAEFEFLQLENIIPDYKATQSYLKRIDQSQSESSGGMTGYEQNQSVHLEALKGKENTEESVRSLQDHEKQHNEELQQRLALENLAQKASDINDDIITLSRAEDYEAMKAKFTELENTVSALTTLKESMTKQKDIQKQLSNEANRHRDDMYNNQKPLMMGNAPKYQSPDVDRYKDKEMKQEQNMLYSQGVDLYKEKKYTEAKLLFDELAGKHDRRADAWLKKVDRALARQAFDNQAGQAKERTAYIAEQVKAQRQLLLIQERERQRQKKLTEELERQKRLFEDEAALQRRKEETLKAQERERERQEAKRLQLEKENEKQEEKYRFHRIETKEVQQPGVTPAVTPAAIPVVETVSTPEALEARRRIVRKQLEDGVEAMYKEALNLYKHGNYTAAAGKFKDVQDIIPGYKHAEEYMNEARQKSLTDTPQQPAVTPAAAAPVEVPSTSSVSREDTVSKALDLFDTNVK